ncbi:MAG: DUF2474 domain-containing protein [Parvibaculaceae bacterium]|nr:DUF2474 domain-containing protein [Parvibaculaceae bacterium]
MTEPETAQGRKPGETRKRLLWFGALWLGGVLALGVFSFAIHAVFPSP